MEQQVESNIVELEIIFTNKLVAVMVSEHKEMVQQVELIQQST
jgi:hypothetical protein